MEEFENPDMVLAECPGCGSEYSQPLDPDDKKKYLQAGVTPKDGKYPIYCISCLQNIVAPASKRGVQ